jgi:hypothetical protein
MTFQFVPDSSAEESVQVRNEDGLVWVKADNVPATSLASELSNNLGIRIVLTGDTNTRMNVNIVEEPLEKAVTKISPSNLVVRETADPSSQIVEVVLMLAEGTLSSAGAEESRFLPSGQPSEDTIPMDDYIDPAEAYDPGSLRDPDRAMRAREAAVAASYDAGVSPDQVPPDQIPPMYAEDLGAPPEPIPYVQQQ